MAALSITRALSELPSLETRIAEAVTQAIVIGAKVSSNGRIVAPANKGFQNEEEVKAAIQASKDRIDSLVKRRSALRAAVAKSNLETTVTICGQTMSVNQALDLKANVLPVKQSLLQHLRAQFKAVNDSVQINNNKLEVRANELYQASISLNQQANTNRDPNLLASLLDSQRSQFQMEIIDPLELRTFIQGLEDEINDLNSQLDFCLSEANAITTIEVE